MKANPRALLEKKTRHLGKPKKEATLDSGDRKTFRQTAHEKRAAAAKEERAKNFSLPAKLSKRLRCQFRAAPKILRETRPLSAAPPASVLVLSQHTSHRSSFEAERRDTSDCPPPVALAILRRSHGSSVQRTTRQLPLSYGQRKSPLGDIVLYRIMPNLINRVEPKGYGFFPSKKDLELDNIYPHFAHRSWVLSPASKLFVPQSLENGERTENWESFPLKLFDPCSM